jgi:hypothetical protein
MTVVAVFLRLSATSRNFPESQAAEQRLMPSLASSIAIVAPIPQRPPVTIATFPPWMGFTLLPPGFLPAILPGRQIMAKMSQSFKKFT